MTKPYISKQKVRDFVSRVSSDKTDAIENECEALLTKEIKSLDAFKRLEDALSEARKAAMEIRQTGFGGSVLANIPTSDFLIDNIGVGDWVVVKSRNGLGLARVLKKAKDLDTVRMQGFKGNVVKQVIAVIDTSKCDKRESDRVKLEEIEKKLEQKAKNAERLTMYRLLAKNDPEFSAILTEYESVKASVDEL